MCPDTVLMPVLEAVVIYYLRLFGVFFGMRKGKLVQCSKSWADEFALPFFF
jgi:hypothetical protein